MAISEVSLITSWLKNDNNLYTNQISKYIFYNFLRGDLSMDGLDGEFRSLRLTAAD